jgi:hypothetical protein
LIWWSEQMVNWLPCDRNEIIWLVQFI